MRRTLVTVLGALFLAGLGVAYGVWLRFLSFLESPGAGGEEKVVAVASALDPPSLARLLAEQGLVTRQDWTERYLTHLYDGPAPVPGEYRLSPAMSLVEILARIRSGKVVTYTVTVPPGANALEICRLLESLGLGRADELIALAYDPRFADELGLPSSSLEGYLFPDILELPRGLAPKVLLGELVKLYRRAMKPALLEAARARGLTEAELVTLASLVEKAPVLPAERKAFAALLHNRLREKMALEVPAAELYGLSRLLKTPETASKDDLRHPWNTELFLGLPSTPIASPSASALQAAAEPADSPALYYARRADGTHVFCEDWECYAAAVQEHTGKPPPRPKKKAIPR